MVLSIPSASMIRAATSVRQVWTRGLGNYDRQFFQFVLLRTVSITVATSIFAAHQALGEVADVLAGIGVTAARAPNSACLHQLSSSGRTCRQPTEAWAYQGAVGAVLCEDPGRSVCWDPSHRADTMQRQKPRCRVATGSRRATTIAARGAIRNSHGCNSCPMCAISSIHEV